MKSKRIYESLRRNWASWAALGLSCFAAVFLVLGFVKAVKQREVIQWVYDQGGEVGTEEGWISRLLPNGARKWFDKQFGDQWSRPLDLVTRVQIGDEEFNANELEQLYL